MNKFIYTNKRKYLIGFFYGLVMIFFVSQSCTNDNKDNPLLSDSFAVTENINPKYYKPAFQEALKQHRKEIKKISEEKQLANFENTVFALDQSGKLLKRITFHFFENNKNENDSMISHLTDWILPVLSDHEKEIYKNEKLASRIKSVYKANFLKNQTECPPGRVCDVIKNIYAIKPEPLTEEQRKLLETYFSLFSKKEENDKGLF